MTMSDRIAVINDGRLQQIDPPLVCYNEPANVFVAGFIGSPSMNLLTGEVTENGFVADNLNVEFDPASVGFSPGDRAIMGVRPEDVYLTQDAGGVSHQSVPIDARSDVLEPMGDEIFVYLLTSEEAETDLEDPDLQSGQLLMSVDPDSEISEDESVQVVLDRSKIHLFDAETRQAVQHGIVQPSPADGATGRAESESDD
jgi:multiple sugar transport system ATP-binding protein